MISLLRTEWLKLKAYTPFWVILALYPVCVGGVLAIALWTQTEVRGAAEAISARLPFAFPHAWQSVAYLASWLYFIPALLLILNVTNEFNFRTHRQNLLEGWSRAQFLGAKLLLAGCLCVYSTAIVGLMAVAAGLKTGTSPTVEGASFLVLFAMQSLAYGVFSLLLAFLIRRAALSLAAFMMYSIVLENIFSFVLNRWVSPGLGAYLPLNAANALLPFPFLKDNAPSAVRALLEGPGLPALLGLTTFYLVFFSGFMWLRFRREDLTAA